VYTARRVIGFFIFNQNDEVIFVYECFKNGIYAQWLFQQLYVMSTHIFNNGFGSIINLSLRMLEYPAYSNAVGRVGAGRQKVSPIDCLFKIIGCRSAQKERLGHEWVYAVYKC